MGRVALNACQDKQLLNKLISQASNGVNSAPVYNLYFNNCRTWAFDMSRFALNDISPCICRMPQKPSIFGPFDPFAPLPERDIITGPDSKLLPPPLYPHWGSVPDNSSSCDKR